MSQISTHPNLWQVRPVLFLPRRDIVLEADCGTAEKIDENRFPVQSLPLCSDDVGSGHGNDWGIGEHESRHSFTDNTGLKTRCSHDRREKSTLSTCLIRVMLGHII